MNKNLIACFFTAVIFLNGCAGAIMGPPAVIKSDVKFDFKNGQPDVKYSRFYAGLASEEPGTVAEELAEAVYISTLNFQQQGQEGYAEAGRRIKLQLVKLWNDTGEYYVQVLDGPFAGIALQPGEKSRRVAVEPGELDLKIFWKNIYSGAHGKKIKHRMVLEGTKLLPISGDYN